MSDDRRPGPRAWRALGHDNPYLDAHRRWLADPSAPGHEALLPDYGFAVPDEDALRLVAAHSPGGVVELGAGTGYWAALLHERGVDVVAFDVAPPPSAANPWFAGREPWFPVQSGDERVVASHPDRTLLQVWPTRDEDWAADAAHLHLASGGRRLVYVGESPGGRTGDLRLHAVLGLVGRCIACTYGVATVPCTCGVTARWRVADQVDIPRWADGDDALYVLEPAEVGRPPTSTRWLPRRAGRRPRSRP